LSYFIGATQINARDDWRHKPVTGGLTGRRQEVFPGDGNLYLTIDVAKPNGVIITGFIEATSLSQLQTNIDAEAARMAFTTLSTVAINGVTFSNQHLLDFKATTPLIPFIDPDTGQQKYKRAVRYTWQGVRH